jgi:hypothetical protein
MSKKVVYLVGIPYSGNCMVGGSSDCFANYANAEKKLEEEKKQKIDYTKIFRVELQDEDSRFGMICGIIYAHRIPNKALSEMTRELVESVAKEFIAEYESFINQNCGQFSSIREYLGEKFPQYSNEMIVDIAFMYNEYR